MIWMRFFVFTVFFFFAANSRLLGNGGAWQTGVPVTGRPAPGRRHFD
jgi:hypothetical protein